ncbi:hypothetical protein [Nocardia thraciensis]
MWRPNIRLAQRFREERVFLAGDAAARTAIWPGAWTPGRARGRRVCVTPGHP